MEHHEVVIIGGGATGCATAYLLSKNGLEVTLIEEDSIGRGASGFAMGLLNCLTATKSPQPLKTLVQEGLKMHIAWASELKRDSGIDYNAHPVDSLYLSFNKADEQELKQHDQYARQINEYSLEWLTRSDIALLEPEISKKVDMGLYVKGPWMIDSYNYTLALSKAAQNFGVQIMNGSVTNLKRSEHGLKEVVFVNGEVIKAKHVVLAMGPWSASSGDWIGTPIPITPLKGQILRLSVDSISFDFTIHHRGNYAGLKPDGLLWIGTTEENVGFDTQTTKVAKNQILESVSEFLPVVNNGDLVQQTACLRPASSDGLPILGSVPSWDGVYISTGTRREGILLSPSIAKANFDLITTGQTELPIDIFTLARF